MTPLRKVARPLDPDGAVRPADSFGLDVLMGLSSTPKQIPSKYFYDAEGSRLFARIMHLPEYYLTRCEQEIFDAHRDDLARAVGDDPFNLVELGPGDGLKTRVLLRAFLGRSLAFRYLPIDISAAALESLLKSLAKEIPKLETEGLVADYFAGLNWLKRASDTRTVVLFLGSNLGNFSQAEARVFLRSLWTTLRDGDLVLIGFDLKKDIDLMLDAYNDTQGVTRAFNLNLLVRINRELGGNFDIDRFRFFSTYDVFGGSMNSYLVSLAEQTVFIEAISQKFRFKPWEPIRTEYSYKYLESDIDRLAEETGFKIQEQFYDARRYFTDSLWRVSKVTRV